jgi:DNA polymerase
MLIGEAPGAEENDRGKPFVGPAGYHLDLMFGECGINRADIRISNAFRYQPYNNNISQFVTFIKTHGQREGWPTFMNGYVKPNMIQHLHDLHDEVERVQPNCIVAMGRTAYWALTGEPPKKNHMLSVDPRSTLQSYSHLPFLLHHAVCMARSLNREARSVPCPA